MPTPATAGAEEEEDSRPFWESQEEAAALEAGAPARRRNLKRSRKHRRVYSPAWSSRRSVAQDIRGVQRQRWVRVLCPSVLVVYLKHGDSNVLLHMAEFFKRVASMASVGGGAISS